MEKIIRKKSFFTAANIALLILFSLFMLAGLSATFLQISLTPFLGDDGSLAESLRELDSSPSFSVLGWSPSSPIEAESSPLEINVSIRAETLGEESSIAVYVLDGDKAVDRIECELPEEEGEAEPGLPESNAGSSSQENESANDFSCIVPLKFRYSNEDNFTLHPVLLEAGEERYAAQPIALAIGWRSYISNFWSFSLWLVLLALSGLVFTALLLAGTLFLAGRSTYLVEYAGEFSIRNILSPFAKGRTNEQKYGWFISSPLFWAMELLGIAILLIYLFVAGEGYKSAEALFSFLLAGAFALPIPLLIAAFFWTADYKEREPLPIIISLFLWGGVAALLSIGINSLTGALFGAVGLAFLTAPLIAPLVEEPFKAAGLVIFSLHHEYDDVVDGIVYGFTIGMGFTFIENWLYLVNNPMGADVFSWLAIFILRSVFFAANHGVFTAFTGAVIGFLKQRGFSWAPWGVFIGMLPAAFLHFAHNSLSAISAICGPVAAVLYLLTAIPLFDYGALVLISALMLYGVYKARRIE